MDAALISIPTKSIWVQEKVWHYRILGNGDHTLVVLAGALGPGSLFAQQIAELLPDVRLLFPEYTAANSIAEFLNAFDAILKVENIQKPIVYGGSFGGLLAQCWARRNAENINVLILSGAAAPDAKRVSTHRRMLKILPFLPMSALRVMMKLAAIKITRKLSANRNLWRKELQNLASTIQRQDLASRYYTAMDFDQNFHFIPNDLSAMSMLLLEGSEDRVANEKVREEVRALYPHAEVITVEGAGHSILLTHPQEWKSAVLKFILNRSNKKEQI